MRWSIIGAPAAALAILSLEAPRDLTAEVAPLAECTICVDGIHEYTMGEPNRFFAALVWGDECDDGDCVDCEEFMWLDGDCGEDEGQHVHPPELGSMTEQEAEEWLEEFGCVPGCPPSQLPSLGSILELLEFSDYAGLRQLIENSSGHLQFNEARGAIQGLGCGDGVMIHVPVDETVASFLQADLPSWRAAALILPMSRPLSVTLLVVVGIVGLIRARRV